MIAAIVAECNPPHSGHAHLISEIRHHFGADICVLMLLSGNYVQRGDLAITDCYQRAAGALAIGADLVLELPFPYSYQTAQIYASSAISLLDQLNGVDYLCFGSECGNLSALQTIADYLSSHQYKEACDGARILHPHKSFAQIRTNLIAQHLSKSLADHSILPNNILAIEYILAIKAIGSSIAPYTIQRHGAYHGDDSRITGYMSAGAIRDAISKADFQKIKDYVTANFLNLLIQSLNERRAPASLDRLSTLILTHLIRVAETEDFSAYFDIDASLAAKMKTAMKRVTDIPSFISLLKAKHLTDAHLRRSVLNAYFGVTSSDVHTAPSFTRLLAANTRGKESLKYIKQHSSLPILSRPSEIRHITLEKVRRAIRLADFADTLYFFSMPCPQPMANLYRFCPIITE